MTIELAVLIVGVSFLALAIHYIDKSLSYLFLSGAGVLWWFVSIVYMTDGIPKDMIVGLAFLLPGFGFWLPGWSGAKTKYSKWKDKN